MILDKIRRSLRLKLILVSLVVEVVMLSLLLGNSLRIINQSIEDQTVLRIEAINPLLDAALGVAVFERDYATLMEVLSEFYAVNTQGFKYIAVLDGQGKVYARVGQYHELPASYQFNNINSAFDTHILHGANPLTLSGEVIGEVRYGLSISSFIASREMLLEQGLFIALLEIVITMILLGLSGYYLTRHLDGLLKGMRAVTRGQYGSDINIKSIDEIGQLAGGFNIMSQAVRDRVEALNESRSELARSKAEFEAIFNNIPDAVLFVDTKRVCISVSPSATRMFGYPLEVFQNRKLDFLYVNREEYEFQGDKRFRPDSPDRDDTYEALFRRKDGSIFTGELLASKVKDNEGNMIGFVGILRDITERKQVETALMEEKERVQVTLESIGDAVITTDADGKVNYLNPVAEKLTGWKTQEVQGDPLLKVFNVYNELTGLPVENPVERCLRENTIVGLTNHTILINRNGDEFAIEDSAAPIRDRSGNIFGVILVFHDVSTARIMAQQLSWQASHDALTGLTNRHEFEYRLKQQLMNAKADDQQHALLYLDLDQFKIVNDTCGHIAGDELLRQLAHLFKECVRENDTLARLGGDEFGVLLNNCPIDHALHVADKLRCVLEEYRFSWEDNSFVVGVSIGVVPITSSEKDISTLLSAADVACYAAKDGGRNRIHLYEPEDSETAARHGEMRWATQIQSALDKNRFVLYCQHILPIKGEVSGPQHYEVLVRMYDPKDELILPMAFIPAAERYNLMPALDRWVIEQVVTQLREKPSIIDMILAINLSGHSLNDDGFLEFVVATIVESKLAPGMFCFEITETAAIANLSRAIAFIKRLRALGCHFSLDDFGSGLSSFNYLKNLQVDYLKIDGAFVKDMVDDPIDRAMVEAINQMGHVMGIKTIAEYVEDLQIKEQLEILGVDYAQGYYIAEPVSFDVLLTERLAIKN